MIVKPVSTVLRVLLAMVFTVALGSCGQKGPLKLPEPAQQTGNGEPPANATPAPEPSAPSRQQQE